MFNSRRDFLKFIGASTAAVAFGACSSLYKNDIKIKSLASSTEDRLKLVDGLDYEILISWGDIFGKDLRFGFNNDFVHFHEISSKEALLWVNHEYVDPFFIAGHERNKKNIDLERKEVGGSLFKIEKIKSSWKVVKNDPLNRRIDGTTKIPFANDVEILGSKITEGTLANCSGGVTPWGNILVCEENYNEFYGERKNGKLVYPPLYQGGLYWGDVYKNPPEHYGWVVEVNPLSGEAKKHTRLGRFSHETATVVALEDGRVAVYSADDKKFEHIYKFVSKNKNSLEEGTLYAASFEKGEWLSLDINDNPVLKKHFKNQLDVLVHCRKAAKLIGATEMDHPEGIAIHPKTGEVFVSLSSNSKRKNYHGSILKISPENSDHESIKFSHETFLVGGPSNKVSIPDNIVFDRRGNLWITTDRAFYKAEKGPYKGIGNNALFVVPASGRQAGEAIQVASAPNAAEFSGLCFSPDYKTLFMSVQHPGEGSRDMSQLSSTWPTGKLPKSSVVMLSGPVLEALVGE